MIPMTNKEQITSEAILIEGKPPWDEPNWQGTAWQVTLSYKGRTLSVPFYMGSGNNGRTPETMEVVECLLADACGADDARDVWDFFDSYGYEPSRDANETYEACIKVSASMHELLGDDFDRFAYPDYEPEEVERAQAPRIPTKPYSGKA